MFKRAVLLILLINVANCFVVRLYDEPGHTGRTTEISIDNSRSCVNIKADFNDHTSSINSAGQCVKLFQHYDCYGRSTRIGPGTPSHNELSKLQFDKEASSVSGCDLPSFEGDGYDPMAIPPETWKEHWSKSQGFIVEDNNTLIRKFYDNDIAVYFDANVNPDANWMFDYMGRVWRHVKQTYGPFGKGRFYFVYHAQKSGLGSVCQPATHLKRAMDFNSGLVCISDSANSWTGTDLEIEMSVHEVAHIVEMSFGGVQDSPALDVWQDSKWAEIFMYDVYRAIGDNRRADAWYESMVDMNRDLRMESLMYTRYSAPGTNWFRDFFYPIYSRYGGAQVLRNFFQLLVTHFPKSNDDNKYSRRMNMGEFVHFWSGAAGRNVLPLAKVTFSWKSFPEFQQQLDQAKRDFSKIQYN